MSTAAKARPGASKAGTGTKPAARRAVETVHLKLIARNMKFSESVLTVPAAAKVKMIFENGDYSVPHNFALYVDATAAESIFVGQIISGPATVDYTFSAPAVPGRHFFRCDVHPVIMTGAFVVTEKTGR